MAWLLVVTLGCIGLLYLQLPSSLPLHQGGSRRLPRPRGPPAWLPSSGLQPQHPAPWPAVREPRQALHAERSAGRGPAAGQPLWNGSRRRLGPRRPRAQLLRVGCGLGTCQVQRLSHRLWQLIASAGPRDSSPVDPSSHRSYG